MSNNKKLIPIINSEYFAEDNTDLKDIVGNFIKLMYLKKRKDSDIKYDVVIGSIENDKLVEDNILRSSNTGLVDYIEKDHSNLSINDILCILTLNNFSSNYGNGILLDDNFHEIVESKLSKLLRDLININSELSDPQKIMDEVTEGKFSYLNHRNLVETGSISNYVSIQNLVELRNIKNTGNSSKEFKSNYVVSEDLVNVLGGEYAGDILAYTTDQFGNLIGDQNIYVLTDEYITTYQNIVSEGDLVDMTIVYHKDPLMQDSEDYDINDPSNISIIRDPKISDLKSIERTRILDGDSVEVKDNLIQFNGKSITLGDDNELIQKIRFIIKPGSININGFTIQINDDNVVIFSTNPSITEYYIKSMIKIETK